MGLPAHNRVAVYHSNRDLRIESRDLPAIGAGELLLEVTASGICGSDIMEWYRRPKAPTVLGHEVAGRVVGAGAGVTRLRVGDRVIATHHVPCLACRYCRSGRETACELLHRTAFDPGGFAAFVRVPAANVDQGGVLPLPDHVSDDAASMVEPLGCVLRGQRRAGVGPGDTVLIAGAGVSGCLHLLAARARRGTCVRVRSAPRSAAHRPAARRRRRVRHDRARRRRRARGHGPRGRPRHRVRRSGTGRDPGARGSGPRRHGALFRSDAAR
jgi:threonine dehydrogenase-like Zn-dependent dehydrogenase